MEVITISHDPFLKKEIKKVIFSEKPKLQLFNDSDVIIGHPSSNLVIASVYTWKEDCAPENIRTFIQQISNYSYLTGYWRTTNGARYAFSNILANPNINKLFVLIFGAEDNGHLLVDALRNFWKNGIGESGIIIGSKAQNPKFEQLPKLALERIRDQCDLVIIKDIKEENFDEVNRLIKKSINEPENCIQIENFSKLNLEFISNVIKEKIIYDDGARFTEPLEVDLTNTAQEVKFQKRELSKVLGQSIQAENLEDAQQQIAAFIYQNGSSFIDERKITNVECRSFTLTILNALERIPSGFSEQYLKDYTDEFMNGPKPGAKMDYNYHDRIFKRWGNQVERVITRFSNIEKSNNSRRAMISLWDPASDLENNTAPCFNLIWVAIRDSLLEFHVLFRSHHLATITPEGKLMPGEGAFVPNIYAIATLQDYIAKQLGLPRGPLVLTDFSGHLYVSKIN